MPEKILKIQEVLQAISAKGTASRVVFSSGAFDLFHYGHFHALKKAARLGNVLVVQIDGNELVRKRKGNDRPCLDEALRAEMVSSLEFVDFGENQKMGICY
ncbi:MAG: Glycerol-3-phosphate cytidyltransferase [Parcubacteria group bacterium GW2011_GWA2_51_12]|nr:MAG: Glycerol-3-phosphate cytidyltransferase [Parcubacteria group bacterium GW2011_GWA2_51_12]